MPRQNLLLHPILRGQYRDIHSFPAHRQRLQQNTGFSYIDMLVTKPLRLKEENGTLIVDYFSQVLMKIH